MHWGIAGVAIATTISQFVSMIVGFVYMYKRYPVFKISRDYLMLDRNISKSILFIGIPMVIQQMVISCGLVFIQSIVNSFGEQLIASYTVACRLEIYMLVPISSIGQAMSTYSGQNYGAK